MKENICSIEKYRRRCDICNNMLVDSTKFTCHTTKPKFKVL